MDKLTDDDLQARTRRSSPPTPSRSPLPRTTPQASRRFADLADPGRRTWSSAPREVPCGAAAQKVARPPGVDLTPVSEEQSVTDVLGKVTSGEADAGLVYVTDVTGAGDDVEGIDVPGVRVGGEHLPDRDAGRQRARRPRPGVRRPRARAPRASRSSPTPASASPEG